MVCTFPGREPTLLELLAVSGALAQPHHAANRGYEALASPSISRFDDHQLLGDLPESTCRSVVLKFTYGGSTTLLIVDATVSDLVNTISELKRKAKGENLVNCPPVRVFARIFGTASHIATHRDSLDRTCKLVLRGVNVASLQNCEALFKCFGSVARSHTLSNCVTTPKSLHSLLAAI